VTVIRAATLNDLDEINEHRWLVSDDVGGAVIAAAYFAPEPFADRVWNLYFLAVHALNHGTGTGTSLIDHIEAALRARGVLRAG